ncbi:hypothetical protein TNCV_725381 [Trichonephila clavipes]|nr:hypothetical protein TNCV_725381 [Trichonephila clavipes]
MATGSYMTPIYSRSQSEVQGDLHKRINIIFFDTSNCSTNRRVPLAVRPLEAFAPRHDNGTPPGTSLTQHPITELPLANAGKEREHFIDSHTHNMPRIAATPLVGQSNLPRLSLAEGVSS